MNTTETLQRMDEITNHYLHELDNFSLEQLLLQPSENEWSLGQMYLHLINTALYMQLKNIDHCRNQSVDSTASAEGRSEAGEAIFSQGGFPPMRIQVPPSPQYTPQQPLNKEQIVEGLQAVNSRMKEMEPILKDISTMHTAQHPRLGGLNAAEWFVLVEMHYRHHLHQKDRLKSYLASIQ